MTGQADGWTRIEPHSLAKVCVVAQCLDNQWVPKTILDTMMGRGLSLGDVQSDRSKHCHAEYMRSLINARQVVVNRGYFQNNPAVLHKYLNDKKQLTAIKELLSNGVIVPFLFKESTPADKPEYSTDDQMAEGWRRLAMETPLTCVRLSWDDKLNEELADNHLTRPFLSFAATAVQLTELSGCAERLARDLGLYKGIIPQFGNQLRAIARARLDGTLNSREDLYRTFVTADGTTPSQGCYDRGKPFSGEIKQLFDLQYNVNLPDALVRLPLTPQDSPGRSVLQELEIRENRPVTAADLVRLIRGRVFEIAQRDLDVPAFEDILPSEVVQIRRTSEWADYAQKLESLLTIDIDFTTPESIISGIQEVSASYGRVAEITMRVVSRRQSRGLRSRWSPAVRFIIKAAGAILFVHFVAGAIVLESIGEVATTTAAELVLEVVIGGTELFEHRAVPTTSYELFRGRMEDPGNQWAELLRSLREAGNMATAAPNVQPSELTHAA